MNAVRTIVGIMMAAALAIVVILTVTDVKVLHDYGFFAEEYEKNKVPESTGISLDDLMLVTRQLLHYMTGQQDELQISVTVQGQQRPFFSERELSHMVDVRNLTLLGRQVRNGCVIFLAAGAVILGWKEEGRRRLCRVMAVALPLVLAIGALLAYGVSRDFTAAFLRFHEIFFTNDLWLLDPSVDLLVNIVPEAFFADTALRIGINSAVALAVCFGLLLWGGRKRGMR
ncbi:MAG TPA: TIGR01906 family membrane protein [Firmicutes bacterium]|nr:TIGR01906 family membrane protein [Bacillota bacterium]